jgi:hypothetical protein
MLDSAEHRAGRSLLRQVKRHSRRLEPLVDPKARELAVWN